MTWPKHFTSKNAPSNIMALEGQLVPQLLQGENAVLEVLRQQYEAAAVDSVELTGAGLYVQYSVPETLPRVVPGEFQGGAANLEIAGVTNGAGCLVFVRDGWLDFLEVYTYDDAWPEQAEVLGIHNVEPLVAPPVASP